MLSPCTWLGLNLLWKGESLIVSFPATGIPPLGAKGNVTAKTQREKLGKLLSVLLPALSCVAVQAAVLDHAHGMLSSSWIPAAQTPPTPQTGGFQPWGQQQKSPSCTNPRLSKQEGTAQARPRSNKPCSEVVGLAADVLTPASFPTRRPWSIGSAGTRDGAAAQGCACPQG